MPTRTNKGKTVQKSFKCKNSYVDFYYIPLFNNNYEHVKVRTNKETVQKNFKVENSNIEFANKQKNFNKTELNESVHNSSEGQSLKINICSDENKNFSEDKLFSDKVDDSIDLVDFSDDSHVNNDDISLDLMDFSDESIVNNNNNLSENTVLTNQENYLDSSLVSQPLTNTNQGTNSKFDNCLNQIKWEDYIVIEAQKLCLDTESILKDTSLRRLYTTVFSFSNRCDDCAFFKL